MSTRAENVMTATICVCVALLVAVILALVHAGGIWASQNTVENRPAQRVNFGPPDSCGPGYRCVRVPNDAAKDEEPKG